MKAVVIEKAGDPEQLIYKDVPRPEVKNGWSLVKVMGFGINHSEIFTRKGLSPSVKFPRILGIECVGIIEETTDPKRLPQGQKVISIMGEMGRAFDGSYAEYVLLPNEQIYPVHTSLDWADLAAVPETYYTAYGSLLNLQLTEKDDVLVRGASSGVGIAFLKLAKALYPGITVVGSSRHVEKEQQLLNAGFDHIVLEKNRKLVTNQVFTKIFELVGPATIKDSFKHLREKGIICSSGQLGNQWYLENFDPITDLAPNSYLTSFYSGNVDVEKLNQLLALIVEKDIDVTPSRVFHLDQLPQAHEYLESTNGLGKVVVLNKWARN
ncbi:zinc-binding dehydrogenase [Limosilactobacillus agrestis]|uniref:Zinc-binding dehydrogenase n=1 Tax=Limosilactobacillus agrestis TaxID=2759748 RepID=A0ABS8R788_9LACO|nr:zinc-binding dehydrogenase [Limosilactobacillus agrestis]MCD7130659.1 zinc-binding dehydrogenase [Limosilactobacillus agrestis]